MGLETATYISGLNASNPVNATDVVGEGDDHLRLVKSTLLNTFPNITGAMTQSHTSLNNALIKTVAGNIISAGNVPSSPTLALESTRPVLVFDDTDAAVDEGRYYIHSNVGQLAVVAINDTNSSSQNAIIIDRTGINVDSIQLYVDNVVNLEAIGGGLARIRSDGNTDTEARALYLSQQNGTLRGQFGYIADGSLRMLNNVHGGSVLIQGEDAGGVTRNILNGDPDGETSIYYNGTLRAQAGAGLFRIRSDSSPGIGSVQSIQFLLEQADGVDLGRVGFPGVANLTLDNFNHGGNVQLRSEDAGGTLRTLLDGDPDGAVALYHDGAIAFQTRATFGLTTRAPSGNDVRHYLMTSAAVDAGWIRASGTTFEVRNLQHGAPVQLMSEDAGGTNRTVFQGDPDAGASMYYAGAQNLITQQHDATGNTSGAAVDDHTAVARDVGFNVLPTQSEDVSDTLEAKHCGGVFFKDGAVAVTLTLEANTSTDFPLGGVCTIINANATADITVTEGTGTTLYQLDGNTRVDTAGGCTVGPGGIATLWREASTVYYIFGSGITP